MPDVVEGAEDVVATGLFGWVPSPEELLPAKAPGALAGLRDPKVKELSGATPNLEPPASENESVWVDSLAGACDEARLGSVGDEAADVTTPKLNPDPTEEKEKALLSCAVVACTDVTVEEATAVTVFTVPCPEILLLEDVGPAVDAVGQGAHTEEGGVCPLSELVRGVCLA